MSEAITREEKIMSGENLTPITRKEMFLAKASGQNIETPTPITREEYFLSKITGGGTGGGELEIYIKGSPTVVKCNATKIPIQAFYNITTLSNVEFPLAESIGGLAFSGCGLASAYFPLTKNIENYAFYDCPALTTVSFPLAESIGDGAFSGCISLETVNFPKLTNISFDTFRKCKNLKSTVCFPLVTNISANAFTECIGLTTLTAENFPLVTSIGDYSINRCTNLTLVDLPSLKSVGQQAFAHNTNLSALIFRAETLCDMDVSALFDTKIVTAEGAPIGEGFVYVPTVLYEDYIADFIPKILALAAEGGTPMDEPTATYIATAILRKIEDYPEICGVSE